MSTPKELLEQRDQILDDYEKGIGLPIYNNPVPTEELEKYLSMNRDIIERLSADECAIIAIRLLQFGVHIQRAQNREISRVSWAKNELKMTIANEVNNYEGYGYEQKSAQAIKGNSHASKVNQIAIYAQQRVDRLNFVSNGLKNLADMLRSIQFNKRNADNE